MTDSKLQRAIGTVMAAALARLDATGDRVDELYAKADAVSSTTDFTHAGDEYLGEAEDLSYDVECLTRMVRDLKDFDRIGV